MNKNSIKEIVDEIMIRLEPHKVYEVEVFLENDMIGYGIPTHQLYEHKTVEEIVENVLREKLTKNKEKK